MGPFIQKGVSSYVLPSYQTFVIFTISPFKLRIVDITLRNLVHAIYREFFFQKQKLKISLGKNDILNIFAQNIDCGYTLEPPRRGGSNEYPQSMFWGKNKKIRLTPSVKCIPFNPNFYVTKLGYASQNEN